MAHLTRDQIGAMGFASVGANVMISDRAVFYNCAKISIGENVRIDDFCVLSSGAGGITIGSYIHIAVHCSVIGAGTITLSDFCNLSSRVAIYSSNDDYSGAHMTNPMVPSQFTRVTHGDVCLGKHVIIGSGSVVVGPANVGEGVAIGALSLITQDCAAFGVYGGTPAKRIKERRRDLLALESQFLATLERGDAK
jgi:acetyltransferase-like isoleucine patch superfamily enzyme